MLWQGLLKVSDLSQKIVEFVEFAEFVEFVELSQNQAISTNYFLLFVLEYPDYKSIDVSLRIKNTCVVCIVLWNITPCS